MKRIWYIFAWCVLLTSWVGALYFSRPSAPSFKQNAVHEMASNGKHIIHSFFDAIGLYFWKVYRPTWQPGAEPTREQKKEQRKLFGYNLRIEHIKDNSPNLVHNKKRPTLFLHGWGDTKGSARLLKAYCDVLPGDLIAFNFRDRGVIMPKIQHSSMGQTFDVMQALYVLKWAKDTLNLNQIDLFGYSRGGATAVNMIGVLNDKTGAFDAELKRIGIDAAERKKLLEIIQNGCVVLNCPLTDLNISANYRFHNFAKKALKALAFVSHYDRKGMQAIDMANKFDGLNIKTLIHFQYDDRVVSNENEAEFYTRLARHNPYHTFIVVGNDGGHLHTHRALSETIHTFKQMYSGSYDPHYVMQYHANKHKHQYAHKLLRPGLDAEKCLNEYYASCKAQKVS